MIERRSACPACLTWLVAMLAAAGCSDPAASDDGVAPPNSSTASEPSTGATGTSEVASDSVDGTGTTSPAETGADGPASTADPTTGTPPQACGDPPVWCPEPSTSWQWQLTGALDDGLDVAMYDVDLFDTEDSAIASLRAEGRVVICYFSAGSHEDWRPDADQFPAAAIGSPLDEWPGERWLDIRDATVRQVLATRLDLASTAGCDGVEPDNVDGYTNDSGFPLTAADQLDFNIWIAEQAHLRGLSVGLKNDLDQVEALLPYFEWALNEECMAYDECDRLAPFIEAGKAVFHVEYVDAPSQGPELAAAICPDALARSFSTLIKGWDLDAWRIACE